MKINHFGFLTKNIEKSFDQYQLLGYVRTTEIIYDKIRGVNLLFMRSTSGEIIELVSPVNKESAIKSLMSKRNNSVYHICYEVEGIKNKIEELSEKGFLVVEPPKPALAFNNRLVAFMLSTSAGLIELLETEL